MFAVLIKDGMYQPVHSKRDLEYMIARGWKMQEVPALLKPVEKKRGRPAKAK